MATAPTLQVNVDTFRVLFPEFAGVDPLRIQLYLDMATGGLDATRWGRCYAKAALYLAAHELAIAERNAAHAETGENGSVVIAPTGAIASASAAGLSVSFAQTAGTQSDAWFSQTPYGQAYQMLQRQCLGRRWRLSW